MTHDQPLRRVRGQDTSGGSGLVRAIVKRLRRKLGEDASALTHSSPNGGCRVLNGEGRGTGASRAVSEGTGLDARATPGLPIWITQLIRTLSGEQGRGSLLSGGRHADP